MRANRLLRVAAMLWILTMASAALWSASETVAKYGANTAGSTEARVAKWEPKVDDDLAAGYTQRVTIGTQPFIFFPKNKDYWHIVVRVENASEVSAACKFRAEVKHTPETAQISGGCTKAAGHLDVCSNTPVLEPEAITAGYIYGAEGVILPPAAGAAASSCEVRIKIPRGTFTALQIYADFIQVD